MSLHLRLGLWLAAGLALLFVLHGFITERAPTVLWLDFARGVRLSTYSAMTIWPERSTGSDAI